MAKSRMTYFLSEGVGKEKTGAGRAALSRLFHYPPLSAGKKKKYDTTRRVSHQNRGKEKPRVDDPARKGLGQDPNKETADKETSTGQIR